MTLQLYAIKIGWCLADFLSMSDGGFHRPHARSVNRGITVEQALRIELCKTRSPSQTRLKSRIFIRKRVEGNTAK